MPSLMNSFEELKARLRQGRALSYASFEPVYYLIFAPREILQVKRELPAWISRLQHDGWSVSTMSFAAEVAQILASSPKRKIWLAAERKDPLAWDKINASLATEVTAQVLADRIEARYRALTDQSQPLLLVTDLEALHPFLRVGAIEGLLVNKVTVPTVFLYPGERTGKTRLKFLGFYPDDGNYRSVHIGG